MVRAMGLLGALWGLLGITALLGSAVGRLAPKTVEALHMQLGAVHWLVMVVWVGFMAFAEGYRGFQQGFSPRVAARARYLRDQPSLVRVLLAPFFLMAYFGAPARRRAVAIGVTLFVVLLVMGVRHVPQPWRGIIDAGVVVGLAWGLISMLVYSASALLSGAPTVDPEVT